jgi:hypothetical protein
VKVVVEFALVHKLRMFCVGWLEFDGNFEIGLGVDALVDLSEGSLIELADDFVILADLFRNLRHSFSI